MQYLDDFTRAYIRCALWSSTDESDEQGGEPIDRNYTSDDLSAESLELIHRDCLAFALQFSQLHPKATVKEWAQAGHDFWLTRNGHGAGFWDGEWPEELGNQLTELSKRFGECNVYVADGGTLEVFNG